MYKNYISIKNNYFEIIAILIFSLIISLSYSYLQYAIDGGLVLSKEINYPDTSSPMLYYYLNSWTLLHQITELFINLGFTAEFSSQIILFFSTFCFSLGVFLLSNSITQNKFLALLITFTSIVLGKNFGDTDYPSLIFSAHTYGMMSLAFSSLIFGLLANRNLFASSFISMVLISIHPLVGIWMMSLLFISLLLLNFTPKDKFHIYLGFCLGSIITLISFTLFYFDTIEKITVDSSLFSIYMEVWDGHRSQMGDIHFEYLFKTLILFTFSFFFILNTKKDAVETKNISVFIIGVSIFFSTILYLSYKIIPKIFPDFLIISMPTRFIMLHSFIGWPLILSFLFFFLNKKFKKSASKILITSFIFLFLILIQNYKKIDSIKNGLIANTLISKESSKVLNYLKILDYKNYIITSSNLAPVVFKKTSKPILLHTESMDFIPYHPYLANKLFDILQKVYEIDKNKPPQKNNPSVPEKYIKNIFENKKSSEWQKIKKEFKIEYLVLPSSWSLDLKMIISDENYSLYKIY